MTRLMSVSYTHLDVYKRQQERMRAREPGQVAQGEPGRDPGCASRRHRAREPQAQCGGDDGRRTGEGDGQGGRGGGDARRGARRACRSAVRRQGHHAHRGRAHDLRLAALQGQRSGRGRRGGGASEERRRRDAR